MTPTAESAIWQRARNAGQTDALLTEAAEREIAVIVSSRRAGLALERRAHAKGLAATYTTGTDTMTRPWWQSRTTTVHMVTIGPKEQTDAHR